MSGKHHEGKYHYGSAKLKRERSRSPRRKDEQCPVRKETIDSSKTSPLAVKCEEKVPLKQEIRQESEQETRKYDNVGLGAKNRLKSMSIQLKLGQKKEVTSSKPKLTVAAAFNQDSDSEPEEMPPEARMRMKNIGRDTPTSSGPNSFGKTKQGFSDYKRVFDKSLKEAMDSALADD